LDDLPEPQGIGRVACRDRREEPGADDDALGDAVEQNPQPDRQRRAAMLRVGQPDRECGHLFTEPHGRGGLAAPFDRPVEPCRQVLLELIHSLNRNATAGLVELGRQGPEMVDVYEL